MIKSEVVKKVGKFDDVQVSIEGTPAELSVELRGILETFESRPEMARILVKAISKRIEKMEDK